MCHVSPVTCHLSPVMCHMSHVPCQNNFFVYIFFFFFSQSKKIGKSGGAGQGRVCFQQGLPCLVFISYDIYPKYDNLQEEDEYLLLLTVTLTFQAQYSALAD